MEKYGVSNFQDLETSTKTVMVYGNVSYDLSKIFRCVYITPVEVPLTKKKKNVDKKRLSGPYGSIIGIQRGNQYRGVDVRKSVKHWCAPNCRETTKKGENQVNVNTVIEKPFLIEGTDVYEIKYYCTKCENYYTARQLKKIANFLNQTTIVLSVGYLLLNIMLFKNNFKVAGCRKTDDAVEAAMILWEDYVKKIEGGWERRKEFEEEDGIRFLFKPVMRNLDFKLGFFINRRALNRLMNSPKYSDRVYMSQCETTSHTNVNIKMFTKRPDGYTYDCLVVPEDDRQSFFISSKKNKYKSKKKKKEKYTTFIAFSSSEVIVSGRYDEQMKKDYEFFVTEIFENRDQIEEKIQKPEIDLVSHLQVNLSVDDEVD